MKSLLNPKSLIETPLDSKRTQRSSKQTSPPLDLTILWVTSCPLFTVDWTVVGTLESHFVPPSQVTLPLFCLTFTPLYVTTKERGYSYFLDVFVNLLFVNKRNSFRRVLCVTRSLHFTIQQNLLKILFFDSHFFNGCKGRSLKSQLSRLRIQIDVLKTPVTFYFCTQRDRFFVFFSIKRTWFYISKKKTPE